LVEGEAEGWLGRDRTAEWNQALMDLGREVCRPVPRCEECPIVPGCRSRGGARPPATRRPAARFEGSMRQVRGAVVRLLRRRRSATVQELARETAVPLERVLEAVDGLARDGLVEASDGADGTTVRLAP
jgi:A/G-specific adenine glycosylase